MINIDSKIKKVFPLVLGGVAVSVTLTSLYKQKKRIEEKEICLAARHNNRNERRFREF